MNFILILTLICIDNTCESFNFRYSLIKRTVLSRVFPLLVNLAKRPSVKQVKVTGAIRFDHPGKRLSDFSGGNNNMFIAVFCNKNTVFKLYIFAPVMVSYDSCAASVDILQPSEYNGTLFINLIIVSTAFLHCAVSSGFKV